MKNIKKIILPIFCFTFGISFSQVELISDPSVSVLPNNSNAFLDASSNYDISNVGDNSIGKGLVFPQVDLTTFKFDTETPDGGAVFPTFYDGMIVYNTVKGQTVNKASEGGIQVDVDKGFYYFSNPEADSENKVSKGKWIRIMDTSELSTGINNGKFWTLKGNEGTKEAKLQDKDGGDYTITDGNFIGTTDAKSLTFATNNIARLTIGATGEISEHVGDNTEPFKFVLKVYGKAKFDKGLVTSASTYPDYVFDNYFTGKSDVNPDYKFKKLNEVEAFIKENNHLPGVTKIDDLAKTESGYEVDNTQLSIQTLEKVEELYLHLIEQQKEIQALKAQIAELKK